MSMIGSAGIYDAPMDWRRHNVGITPHFFTRSEPKLDSDGKPIVVATGKPAEHVFEVCRIMTAGDPFTETCVPVDAGIKERFAEQYARWKSNDETTSGTRLRDWSEANLSERLIRDLNDLHIMSVEDLAALSDSHVTRVISDLRNRALVPESTKSPPESTNSTTVEFQPSTAPPEVRFQAKMPEAPAPDAPPAEPAPLDLARPPKRFPTPSKTRWQTIPAWVREDVIAREDEFDKAFKRYDGLGQYAIAAERSGTTLLAVFASIQSLRRRCGRTLYWARSLRGSAPVTIRIA